MDGEPSPRREPDGTSTVWLLDLVSTKRAKANGHDRDEGAQWVARLWEDGSPPGQQRHDLARLVGYYAKLRQPKEITIAQAWDLVQRKFRNGRSGEPWTCDDVVTLAEDIYEKDSAQRAYGTQHWHLAKDVKPEKIDWIWPGRLARGKVTILDGDPAQAKTSVTIDLAARISTGTAMPHEQLRRTPAGAVIVNYEDGAADTIVPRLIAAGADLSRIIIFDLNAAPTISDPEDLKMIEDAIKAVDAIYLVVDPLMAGVSDKADSHNDHKMRRALRPLRPGDATPCRRLLINSANFSRRGRCRLPKSTSGSSVRRTTGRSGRPRPCSACGPRRSEAGGAAGSGRCRSRKTASRSRPGRPHESRASVPLEETATLLDGGYYGLPFSCLIRELGKVAKVVVSEGTLTWWSTTLSRVFRAQNATAGQEESCPPRPSPSRSRPAAAS